MAHGKFEDFENADATESDKDGSEEAVLAEDDKFEEIAEEWDSKNCSHDADNDNEESATQVVERAGNPIDKK